MILSVLARRFLIKIQRLVQNKNYYCLQLENSPKSVHRKRRVYLCFLNQLLYRQGRNIFVHKNLLCLFSPSTHSHYY